MTTFRADALGRGGSGRVTAKANIVLAAAPTAPTSGSPTQIAPNSDLTVLLSATSQRCVFLGVIEPTDNPFGGANNSNCYNSSNSDPLRTGT